MLALGSMTLPAQQIALVEGPSLGDLTVRIVDGATGATLATPLQHVRFTTVQANGRTRNESAESWRPRQVTRDDLCRIELPDGGRLFCFQTATGRQGVLSVPADGHACVVLDLAEEIEPGFAVATDGGHAVVADDRGNLHIARLDGTPFPSTGMAARRITPPAPLLGPSLMAGATHFFFVTAANQVYRCAFAEGGAPENITPGTPGAAEMADEIAIAGDGASAAFLRGVDDEHYQVFVVGPSGAAREMALPASEYRQPGYLGEHSLPATPFVGHPHLLLNHDGSRLMVTEVRSEDELFYVDTTGATPPIHMTRDTMFSPYIGIHILPAFVGTTLVVALGHVGWMDWFSLRTDGTTTNLTQTGSSEPPFLVGMLDVQRRYPLANGNCLGTEDIGTALRVRLLELDGSTVVSGDATAEPEVGAAFTSCPDLRLVTQSGEQLLSGADGRVLLAVPPGVHLTDPVRSASGIVATHAFLQCGLGAPVLLLPGGGLLVGQLLWHQPRLAFDANGGFVCLFADRLEVFSSSGRMVMPLAPQPIRRIVSGAAN